MKRKDKVPLLLKVVRMAFPILERVAPPLAHRFFVWIFFTPLRYPEPEKERAVRLTATPISLQVNGRHLQGYVWGEGPVVVVVHGWAGRAAQFRNFIEPLRHAGYKVVGFDAPAHGKSAGKQASLFDFEAALKAVYQKVGEPVGIIAHSFGGGATLFSFMRGLPVKRLVMIASPSIDDEILNTFITTIGGSWRTAEAFKAYVLQRYGQPFHEFTARYFLQQIPQNLPLLLVYDEEDREVPIVHADAIVAQYPAARLIRTRGLGHTRILKDEAVIEACVTFMGADASG